MGLRKSLSLLEMMTVLAVLGVGILMTYSVLHMNWFSFDSQITRLNLAEESRHLMDMFSLDARSAMSFQLAPGRKRIDLTLSTITSPVSTEIVTYEFMADNSLVLTRRGVSRVLSRDIDFANSSFDSNSAFSVEMNLALEDMVFGEPVRMQRTLEVCLRNVQ